MNRALLVPIISLLALTYKGVTHQTIPDETLDIITNAVLSLISLFGIFMNPAKKNEEASSQSDDSQNVQK